MAVMPRGRVRDPRRARRRPAAVDKDAEDDMEALWNAGNAIPVEKTMVGWLMRSPGVVFEEAKYFHKSIKLAGVVQGSMVKHGQLFITLKPTGTTEEAILKLVSARANWTMRVHLCEDGCNREETAEDLAHGVTVRSRRLTSPEEPWIDNLDKVVPLGEEDELDELRRNAGKALERKEEDPAKEKDKRKDKKEDKRKDKDKKKKKKRSQSEATSEEEESTGKIALDGSRPKAASQKKGRHLFGGTALDPRPSVRSKIAKKARKFLAKKGRKEDESSGSSSGSEESGNEEALEQSIFTQAGKVRTAAEQFPGSLSCQTLNQMRMNLLESIGIDDKKSAMPAVAVQYYRQVLQKKANGPAARELLTIAVAMDMLLKSRPSHAMDVLSQRFKAIESGMSGAHWTVTQRLELIPQDALTLTGVTEMKEARREQYDESKLRWQASLPDGRGMGGQRGNKGKGGGKEDTGKGKDSRKGNKWQGGNPRNEPWKKKDDSGTGGKTS